MSKQEIKIALERYIRYILMDREEELAKRGCRIVSVKEFLNLSDAEDQHIELKLSQSSALDKKKKD